MSREWISAMSTSLVLTISAGSPLAARSWFVRETICCSIAVSTPGTAGTVTGGFVTGGAETGGVATGVVLTGADGALRR